MADIINFLDYIEKTNNATTTDEIFSHFEQALYKLGFDLTLYSLITDHTSIKKSAGHGIMRNYPEDWMKYYTEKRYVDIDPVIKQAMRTNTPFLWDKISEIFPYSNAQHQLMHEAHDAGFNCGVGLGIHSPNGEVAGFGFASSDGTAEINQNVLSLLKALATQFHTAYIEQLKSLANYAPTQINITDLEKELLYLMMMGKSNSVISDVLKLNPHNVDYHVRTLFNKLEANNRTYAVVKAIRHGLIKP
jgi:DNA-binding CsgD family transcriptional regulator